MKSITMKMAQAIAKDLANGVDPSTVKESVRELASFFILCIQTWESWAAEMEEYDKALRFLSSRISPTGETRDALNVILRWRRPAPLFREDDAHCYPSGGTVCVFCGHDPESNRRTPCLTPSERGDMVQSMKQKVSTTAKNKTEINRGDWVLREDGSLILYLGNETCVTWDEYGVIGSPLQREVEISGHIFSDDDKFKTTSFFTAILKMLAKNIEVK